jgi:hypothetical protein
MPFALQFALADRASAMQKEWSAIIGLFQPE